MVKSKRCPECGEIGWLTMDPQLGREQKGRRPVICLSPATYNRKSGLAIFCPITSHAKGYPFEVPVQSRDGINGVVLADQIKSLDWNERDYEKAGRCTTAQMAAIISKISALLIP